MTFNFIILFELKSISTLVLSSSFNLDTYFHNKISFCYELTKYSNFFHKNYFK